ncbi:hypothetical protein HK096_000410, partial [Nowakowskiella sp. JEL0078]
MGLKANYCCRKCFANRKFESPVDILHFLSQNESPPHVWENMKAELLSQITCGVNNYFDGKPIKVPYEKGVKCKYVELLLKNISQLLEISGINNKEEFQNIDSVQMEAWINPIFRIHG